jgi:hypothetical protein
MREHSEQGYGSSRRACEEDNPRDSKPPSETVAGEALLEFLLDLEGPAPRDQCPETDIRRISQANLHLSCDGLLNQGRYGNPRDASDQEGNGNAHTIPADF